MWRGMASEENTLEEEKGRKGHLGANTLVTMLKGKLNGRTTVILDKGLTGKRKLTSNSHILD